MGVEYLEELFKVILDRKENPRSGSYTCKLLSAGAERIARKLCEEALETAIELLKGDKEGVVREAADLVYHLFVALAYAGASLDDLVAELEARRRHGR